MREGIDMKLSKHQREILRKKFKEDTGINWQNEQGEPDIDYVEWLEDTLADYKLK